MQRINESGKAREETRLQLLTRTLLQEVAGDLDSYWGGGDISPSGYETAWVAMVRDPRRPEQLAFPESLEWLFAASSETAAGRAAFPIRCFLPWRRDWRWQGSPTDAAVQRAGTVPEVSGPMLPQWDLSSYDSPLFEFLLPVLVDELAALGIQTVAPQLNVLRRTPDPKAKASAP